MFTSVLHGAWVERIKVQFYANDKMTQDQNPVELADRQPDYLRKKEAFHARPLFI